MPTRPTPVPLRDMELIAIIEEFEATLARDNGARWSAERVVGTPAGFVQGDTPRKALTSE